VSDDAEFLRNLYRDFNARHIDTVLAALHEDVLWANGMEGGHLHGREAVRAYWIRQWSMIDPSVEPTCFSTLSDGAIRVDVRQTVRDLAGNLLREGHVCHLFCIEQGKIRRFDILESGTPEPGISASGTPVTE
jgi:nuclear transport factor 2 (NTF2) superfamily protein